MEAFYQQKWVQLVRPEVRMSNPPYPRKMYAAPEPPEPFFRDQSPGFLGVASEGGPVISTSASASFLEQETARPPEVENVFAPREEEPVRDVPLQAPGEINPLFEPRSAKAPPQKETRGERATKKATEKRQDEINKRRFAPPPPSAPPQPPLRNAKAPPTKETAAQKSKAKGTEKRQEELNKRRAAPPPPPVRQQPKRNAKAPSSAQTSSRAQRAEERATKNRQDELNKRRVARPSPVSDQPREEFGSFAANKRQMSRIGRDPPRN